MPLSQEELYGATKANKKKKKESENRRRKLNAMNGPSPLR